ncbi:MAG: hypothetical protein INR71_15585 [Terriglobus roseus]|nr:hypothetical protein [Terriglobus roseus]
MQGVLPTRRAAVFAATDERGRSGGKSAPDVTARGEGQRVCEFEGTRDLN